MKKKPLTAPWEITSDMFLSEAEVEQLLNFLRNRERDAHDPSVDSCCLDRLIVELLLYSGLRNSELCQLRLADTIVGHGESKLIVAEASRQIRTVFLPRNTSELVSNYAKQIRPKRLRDDVSATDLLQPLLINERGNPYDRTALYRRVVRVLTEAGLEDRASVQLLRHTYGFLAYKRTRGNLLFVQRQLGHAHPMVTAIYAQFFEIPSAELAELVGQSGDPKTDSVRKPKRISGKTAAIKSRAPKKGHSR